jgi:hypothetical protein
MRLVNARESMEPIRLLVVCLIINLINKLLTTMLVLLAPPLPGGSGTFSIATWNIRSSQEVGLMVAAKGLRHLGVGCAVLTETKLTKE